MGLTVLSPHVTQGTNRRLADDWKCPQCTLRNNGRECRLCGAPKPIMPAVWRCSVCTFDNDSERTTCLQCHTQRQAVRQPPAVQASSSSSSESFRVPRPEAPQMPHCCMPLCYDECGDCEGKGCQSCDQTGRNYVCTDGSTCGWSGPGSECPGKICPEAGCGSRVYVPKDLVYLRCNHIICKSCFDAHIETVVREDTISCPLPKCNYKVQPDEQREYMEKEKYDRRDEILNNKVLAESGLEYCPKNAETGCTWGYMPPRPRPCEDCGGTLSMTMTERVHVPGTWLPYRSSYDEDRVTVTPCERCEDTPGIEPNQAYAVTCKNENCCFKFCSGCKKGWDHERSCPRNCDRNGKIKARRGGVRGFFGGTKRIDCPECDGRRAVDVRTHEGKTCEQYAVALSTTDKDAADQQHEQDDEETRRWKRENTRKCPNCNVDVIKAGAEGETAGCNHMTCTCGKEFCWTCGADAFPPVNGENRGARRGGYCYTSWCATANGGRGKVIRWD